MFRVSHPAPSRAAAAATAAIMTSSMLVVPPALAQSSLTNATASSGMPDSSSLPASSGSSRVDNSNATPPQKTASEPYTMPDGTVIQIMGDVLGPHSKHVGLGAGDLGTMAPIGDGEFAMVFGDSFSGQGFGRGEWMSPVGVVAKIDENGFLRILRPLNRGKRVKQTVGYLREDQLTLIPSDVINIDGTLYLQGMWNRTLGDVIGTQIWRSTDGGQRWESVGRTNATYMNHMGELLSWERGPDGYIYVVSTSFDRSNPVYLSRFSEADMGDRSKWQLFDPTSGQWGDSGTPILADGVKAGEMNLRYIDGHWVLVLFNEDTLQIEVRIAEDIARDWNDVPTAVVAKHGSWGEKQTPLNWSQPYGGYIVPGSRIGNMDIVVSQWNTANNSRYMATQFNVRGLDRFFGIDSPATEHEQDLTIRTLNSAVDTPEMAAENDLIEQKPTTLALSSEPASPGGTAAFVVGILAAVGALAALSWPLLQPLLPAELRAVLPFD